MRIYTKSGDLAFKTFTFPDGQPHFKLETYERDFTSVIIEMAIKSPTGLLEVLLVNDVLRQHGYAEVQLDVRYLMGARMDRAISTMEPYTLQTIARCINSCGFSKVRILDAHSDTAIKLIRNSENVLPQAIVKQIITTTNCTVVVPDRGATPRVDALIPFNYGRVQCYKKRDISTGMLSGFSVDHYESNPNGHGSGLLLVDDICDGGGTFVGLAKELRKRGAKSINLFVTHGIFSKGTPLEGIDQIYTTDSLCSDGHYRDNSRRGSAVGITTIPISMKELK